MRHPTDGILRRLVDEPAGVPDPDRQHVAGCPVCLRGLAAAQQDATAASAALHAEVSPDVDRAFRQLSARVAAEERSASAAPAARARRRWQPLRSPVVDALRAGVTGEPTYTVGDQLVADFTFSAARAEQAAAAAGESLPPVPDGLDGSRFRLVAGPGTAATWSEARGVPALVVARVAAPTASSTSGVSFEAARDYLLSVPGLPDDLAA